MLIPHANIPAHFEQLALKQYIIQHIDSDRWETTEQGNFVLTKLDEPTLNLHRRQFSNFSAGEITDAGLNILRQVHLD